MFVLHVDLKVRPDSNQSLESTFREAFLPAISAQPGFDHVLLLKAQKSQDEYRLMIAFHDAKSQKAWVASDLHQEVWPRIEKDCSSYTVEFFDSV